VWYDCPVSCRCRLHVINARMQLVCSYESILCVLLQHGFQFYCLSIFILMLWDVAHTARYLPIIQPLILISPQSNPLISSKLWITNYKTNYIILFNLFQISYFGHRQVKTVSYNIQMPRREYVAHYSNKHFTRAKQKQSAYSTYCQEQDRIVAVVNKIVIWQ